MYDTTAYEPHSSASSVISLLIFCRALVKHVRHGRMFALAVNNATTHAKKENPDICQERKANVWEEKDFCSKYEAHLFNTQSASLLLIIRHDEMNWNAPCRIDPSAGDIVFYKQRR